MYVGILLTSIECGHSDAANRARNFTDDIQHVLLLHKEFNVVNDYFYRTVLINYRNPLVIPDNMHEN